MLEQTLTIGDNDHADHGPVHDAQWLMSGHNRWAYHTYRLARDGVYDIETGKATYRTKYKLGYAQNFLNNRFGPDLYKYLTGEKRRSALMVVRASRRAAANQKVWIHPLRGLGKFIGFPGQGTHSYVATPNNWQSDHAWDISVPVGTAVVAVHDGVIDPRIGRIGEGRFAGIRLYVNTADNSIYYAHLSKVIVKAGDKVKAGQILGYTGSANGVPHLHIAWQHDNPLHFPVK
jgi:murein DD-endopeptidase MepM/ murein hydrolase activator NlpD